MNLKRQLSLIFKIVLIIHSAKCYKITLFRQDNQQDTALKWTVDYAQKSIDFTIKTQRNILNLNNEFGFGLSNYGSIENADVLLIKLNRNESITIQDCWTDGNGTLEPDIQQNYNLTGYEIKDNATTISFTRRFDTCDSQDFAIDNGTTNIFTVINIRKADISSSNFQIDLNSFKIHKVRVQLLKPDISYTPLDIDKLDKLRVQADNVEIPSAHTTYWCSVHKLPEFKSKIHGIGFESVITNPGLVHHIEVFTCDVNDKVIPYYSGKCDSKNMPEQLTRCNRVLAAWAFGAEALFYPKEAGLAFGVPEMSQYVRLEIHYNNPNNLHGVIDNSGIKFYLSNRLRKYDVGTLEVGVTYTPSNVIPPAQKGFKWKGICPASCTKAALPKKGINVFAAEMHTHLAGRKIWLSHYRNGKVLPEIIRDNHYSTWFEEIRTLPEPVKVLPGDTLVTTCTFDTFNKRQNLTFGGLGLTDEMCVLYLNYYPASKLEVCKSSVSERSLQNFFERIFRKWTTNRKNIKNATFVDLYSAVDWTKENIIKLALMYGYGHVDVLCHNGNGMEFKGKWKNVGNYFVQQKLKKNSKNCKN